MTETVLYAQYLYCGGSATHALAGRLILPAFPHSSSFLFASVLPAIAAIFDSLTLVALVGAALVALATLITGIAALLVYRYPAFFSGERARTYGIDSRKDDEYALIGNTPEMIVQPQIDSRAQEQQIGEKGNSYPQTRDAEAIIQETLRIESLADEYRKKLCTDPGMTQLQILAMSWPLDLQQSYVQLRLHQQELSENILPPLLRAEALHDPNDLLRVERQQLERHLTTAIDPTDAIRLYRRCVILGDPGVGKTTLLKYLALRCAKQELRGLSDLPIYIDLNLFAQEHRIEDSGQDECKAPANPLLVFASAQWDKQYGFPQTDALAYMQKRLEDGNALLLLDGLDETFIGENTRLADENYERVAAAIRRLIDMYRDAFIVVTARTAEYSRHVSLPRFTEASILGLRLQDIEAFIHSWFTSGLQVQQRDQKFAVHGTASNLLAQFSNLRLQALASTPLLLAEIVIIYQRNTSFPARRSDLYSECADILLERWDIDQSHIIPRDRLRLFSKTDKERLLKAVAWHFHNRGLRYYPLAELEQVVAEFLVDGGMAGKEKQALEEVCAASGLLKEQASNWYGFLHVTLQEYFAAQAPVSDPKRFDELLEHAGDPWWEEVILLYAGSVDDASPLLEALWRKGGYDRKEASDYPFYTFLLLAGQCLITHPIIKQKMLRQQIIQRLFKELSTTRYALARQQLAQTLVQLGHERFEDLASSSSYVRGNHQGNEHVKERVYEYLLDMIYGEDEVKQPLQLSIAQAFKYIASSEVVKKLIDYLSNEWIDPDVRIAIVQALDVSGIELELQRFVELLRRPMVNQDVRLSIADMFSRHMDVAIIPALAALLPNNSVSSDIRCAIIDALGSAGHEAATPYLQDFYDRVKPNEMKPRKTSLWWHTSISLVALGKDTYLDNVLALLNDKVYPVETRCSIVSSLSSLRLPFLIPHLLSSLKNEHIHWQVRATMAIAIEATGDRSIVADLFPLLADKNIDELVRVSVASVLGTSGDQRLIPPLRHLQEEIDCEQTPTLYRMLEIVRGKLGDSSVANDLLDWLANQQTRQIQVAECLAIVDALQKLPAMLDPDAQSDIIRLARAPYIDTEVQRAIIALLPQILSEARSESVKLQALQVFQDIFADPQSYDDVIDEAYQALWKVRRYLPQSFVVSR